MSNVQCPIAPLELCDKSIKKPEINPVSAPTVGVLSAAHVKAISNGSEKPPPGNRSWLITLSCSRNIKTNINVEIENCLTSI
jgi:hypothetical protein